jgi:hypothetical protein
VDGFLHITDPQTGLAYNGNPGHPGIEVFAERGIVGRGVLLDVARWAEAQARPIDWEQRCAITVADLEACAAWHDVHVEEGTILLVRVGWQQA